MLAAARQERDELRGQERTAPDISAHIHKLETETIPDLETHKRHMENELNSVAEEIPKAKERKEAEETLHQLQGEKQILQDQLDGLRMAEKLERYKLCTGPGLPTRNSTYRVYYKHEHYKTWYL